MSGGPTVLFIIRMINLTDYSFKNSLRLCNVSRPLLIIFLNCNKKSIALAPGRFFTRMNTLFTGSEKIIYNINRNEFSICYLVLLIIQIRKILLLGGWGSFSKSFFTLNPNQSSGLAQQVLILKYLR